MEAKKKLTNEERLALAREMAADAIVRRRWAEYRGVILAIADQIEHRQRLNAEVKT